MQENVINKIYIGGEFVTPHGTELFDLFNPATGKVIGQVQLADEVDTEAAVAAAKRALPAWSATSKEERIDALRRLQAGNMVTKLAHGEYRFEDEAFARWIREQGTLGDDAPV